MIWMFRHPVLSIGVIFSVLSAGLCSADMLIHYQRLFHWPLRDFLVCVCVCQNYKCAHKDTALICNMGRGLTVCSMYKTFHFIQSVNIPTILATLLTTSNGHKSSLKVKPKSSCIKASSFYESLENMKGINKDSICVLVCVSTAILAYLHSEFKRENISSLQHLSLQYYI